MNPMSTASDNTSFHIRSWNDGWGLAGNLLVYFLFFYIMSILCVSLSIPSGAFAPVFAAGAGAGKLFGVLLHDWGVTSTHEVGIVTTSFAVVGASALSSGVTHTISAAIIVIELTGQLQLLLPCLLACIPACGIASVIGESIYDSISRLKGIPVLPPEPSRRFKFPHKVAAFHVMLPLQPDDYIVNRPTASEVRSCLTNSTSQTFAVVHSEEKKILQGEVNRETLEVLLDRLEDMAGKGVTSGYHPPIISKQVPTVAVKEDPSPLLLSASTSPHTGSLPLPSSSLGSVNPPNPSSRAQSHLTQPRWTEPTISLFSEEFSKGVNQSPLQITAHSPLSQVYATFHMLVPRISFVTHNGVLLGVITEQRLIDIEDGREKPHSDVEVR